MRNEGDKIFLVRMGYWWKIFEQIVGLLLLLILKSRHQRLSVKKGALKNFADFARKDLSWSIFSIKLQGRGPATFLKRDSNTGVFSSEISEDLSKKSICEPKEFYEE